MTATGGFSGLSHTIPDYYATGETLLRPANKASKYKKSMAHSLGPGGDEVALRPDPALCKTSLALGRGAARAQGLGDQQREFAAYRHGSGIIGTSDGLQSNVREATAKLKDSLRGGMTDYRNAETIKRAKSVIQNY